jgi:uncharacterized protein (UPF0264 family)
MLDTRDKSAGRNLLDIVSPTALRRFVERAHRHGLEVALAGSLRAEDVPRVREVGAEIVGIRAAACAGDRRSGRVTWVRVARIRQMIPITPPVSPAPLP